MLYSSDISNEHSLLRDILQTRGMDSLPKNYPLWKFKLSDEEYDGLKRTIQSNVVYLYKFGIEAALCYAEWWRRDYRGYYPNKEQVAIDVGVLNTIRNCLMQPKVHWNRMAIRFCIH